MVTISGIRHGAIEGVVASKATFYHHAAERTVNPIGKRVFLSVMESEKKHLRDLRAILKEGHTAHCSVYPASKIRVFLKKISVIKDDTEALKIAMEMEKESIELYGKLSKQVRTGKEKAFFQNLLSEEQQRYAELSDICLFLSDSCSWFMWEECSMMDGGTSWA
ncbi:MAG TPA: ferritin family protein [Thermodesulfovibrionales bacterium]|nr:ferritin family protein [Thermodesulfovibrionales bacterium]